MKYAKIGALLLLGALPIAAIAQNAIQPAPSAERSEAREKYRAACGADIQKFCGNVERAKGAMRSCLTEHAKDLSPACKTAREERAAARGKDKS